MYVWEIFLYGVAIISVIILIIAYRKNSEGIFITFLYVVVIVGVWSVSVFLYIYFGEVIYNFFTLSI